MNTQIKACFVAAKDSYLDAIAIAEKTKSLNEIKEMLYRRHLQCGLCKFMDSTFEPPGEDWYDVIFDKMIEIGVMTMKDTKPYMHGQPYRAKRKSVLVSLLRWRVKLIDKILAS